MAPRRSSARRQSANAAPPQDEPIAMEVDEPPAVNGFAGIQLPPLPNGAHHSAVDSSFHDATLLPLPPLPSLDDAPAVSSSSKPPRAVFGTYTALPTMFGNMHDLPARPTPRKPTGAASSTSLFPEASTSSQTSTSAAAPARQYSQKEIAAWRNTQVDEKQAELAAIVDRHDDHVRELFHLDRFVTLIGFDPVVAKGDKSDVFTSFQHNYDLFENAAPSVEGERSGRRATRRAVTDRKVGLLNQAETTPSSSRKRLDFKGKGRAEEPALMFEAPAPVQTSGDAVGDLKRKRSGGRPKKGRRSMVSAEETPEEYVDYSSYAAPAPQMMMGARPPRGQHSFASGSALHSLPLPEDAIVASLTELAAFYQRPPSPQAEPDSTRAKGTHGGDQSVTYSHHQQLPPLAPFDGSIPALFATYFNTNDDEDVEPPPPEEELDERAEYDAEILLQLDALRAESVELFNPDQTRSVEPDRLPDHQQHLVEQALHFGKLVHDERKAHITMGRKIGRMVLNHFAGLRGKEERIAKDEEKNQKALARWTMKEVKKKWKLAINVVKARRKARLQEEQDRLGKEQLNLMLDKSTTMLQAQQVEMAGESESESEEEESDADEDEEQEQDEEAASEAATETDTGSPAVESSPPSPARPTRANEGRPRRGRSTLSISATPLDSPTDSPLASALEEADGDDDDVFDGPEDDGRDQEDENMEAEMEAEDEEDDSELGGLAEEADMPIEELLHRSGYRAMMEAEAGGEGETEVDTPREDDQSNATPAVEASAPPSESATPAPDLTAEEAEAEAMSEFGSDGDEAREDEDEQLEEAMEAEEAGAASDDSEMDGLAEDADLPIEELLQKYGYGPADDSASGVANSPAVQDSKDELLLTNGNHIEEMEDEEAESAAAESPAAEEEEEGEEEAEEDDSPVEKVANIRPPFLLRGSLRPYQQAGLEWLASLYTSGVNGILADEMGLGKTIQTISLLAHLACDKGQWGPHLVVVPTSVMLNWEMEFKKFLPGFKILTYYGTQKERKEKRRGWNTENHFHVCVTSYQLILADQHMFRRKPWHYMILDEAHHIKNFRSQRWQTLLGFNARHRLLLTGTPLQNNLMELWSLLYFLMPHGLMQDGKGPFADHADFQAWFSNPMEKAIETDEVMDEETKATVNKLHTVLRPYLLRRLKSEVETQMPGKTESIIYCRLSKRQRFLYDDFMSRSATRETLGSGHFLSIINCLMQLRKVCNHPDLFEVRPIVTSFAMNRSVASEYETRELLVRKRLFEDEPIAKMDWSTLTLVKPDREAETSSIASQSLLNLDAAPLLSTLHETPIDFDISTPPPHDTQSVAGWKRYHAWSKHESALTRLQRMSVVNTRRCRSAKPFFGHELLYTLRAPSREHTILPSDIPRNPLSTLSASTILPGLVKSLNTRAEQSDELVAKFGFVTPKVKAADMPRHALAGLSAPQIQKIEAEAPVELLQRASTKLSVAFPDRSLLQYDCGKLQKLDELLRECKAGGHRVLIFTQMTKVLDILEEFLSFHGHRYLRLDGSTKIEQRQIITERFNSNDKILCFISSTRSGGLGINLQGADTVIFYDSDWNPALDRQCQDRAHRIGQTREVRIWRFVTEHSIEENMLKKANQKRRLDELVIAEGDFTTDYLAKLDWRDYLDENQLAELGVDGDDPNGEGPGSGPQQSAAEIRQALAAAEDEEDAVAAKAAVAELEVDQSDFTEQGSTGAGGVALGKVVGGENSASASPAVGAGTPMEEEEEDEEDPLKGTIDGYMLNTVEEYWDDLA